ncbi:hypothetical protein MKZ38_000908 [Zalerion maritima]|uniref:Zn(2)-C6 fungal-type domain-containing protein n=1 Tax=Zalerion maritima TaxID=339359 RepID=A0AAD5WX59_9PEZI|nr:hypothetical protein MKZ38_000908 [Zalerion maritima]
MTVTSSKSSPPLTTKDATIVRKRRRRAPAGGASDDCFTCTKRSVKCDRRRPYCSQCLEIGNECSGYKTQLTWGVGVASRGKLRGLSLPIAKSPPVPVQGKKASPARSRASSAAASNHWADSDEYPPPMPPTSQPSEGAAAAGQPTTRYAPYDIPLPMSGETTPSMPQGSWPGGLQYPPKLTTHLSHIPVTSEALSSSVDSLSDVDYMSPLSHSFSREDLPFVHSPGVMYESYTSHSSPVPQSPVSTVFIEHRPAPTSCPSLAYAPSEPGSNMNSSVETYDSSLAQKVMSDCDSLGVPDLDNFSSSYQSSGPSWPSSYDEDARAARSFEATSAQWPSSVEAQAQNVLVNPDLAAKMPFFTDYYRNTMCPTMVLIDGPGNPYREHILQLAQGSQSLRHAICALSACNLRMKRKLSLNQHRRGSSETKLPKTSSETGPDAPPGDQSVSEEYQHRNLAVHLLNQQLNDPSKSIHDSVLATILLLCHYRMVESGIAKFHTQFAGVKKILGMRRSAQYQAPSRDAAWMEAVFTYFDAISASTNDRESQLDAAFFRAAAPDSHLLAPGAENLVGCDRELFKTIGKLGRLNLLSQRRPVAQQTAAAASPAVRGIPSRSQSQSPLGAPLGHAYKTGQSLVPDFFSIPPTHRYDGNGFGATIDEEEMAYAAAAAAATAVACSPPQAASFEDSRSVFWREWKEARQGLQGWEFDSQALMASLPGSTTTAQIRDLGSLSEAFRYAALLYTERLASPASPPSQPSLQNLVSQVVFYATSLEAGGSAEKFLLWPLFVAGSECVNGLQQGIVRSKCREITARSGYMNNLAALEVLEQIWARDSQMHDASSGMSSGPRMGAPRRGPFSWTSCIGGPGVEVEWIMF